MTTTKEDEDKDYLPKFNGTKDSYPAFMMRFKAYAAMIESAQESEFAVRPRSEFAQDQDQTTRIAHFWHH